MGKIYIGISKVDLQRKELRVKRAKIVLVGLVIILFSYAVYKL